MTAYAATRVAAGDLANALVTAGVGALAFNQVTPGMFTLGPTVAHALAQQAAVASFPLGAGIGGLWYGAMPATAPVALVRSEEHTSELQSLMRTSYAVFC